MKISLDGGVTWQPAPEGVRIVLEDQEIPGEDVVADLNFNFTDEGIIYDIWQSVSDTTSTNLATRSQDYDAVLYELMEHYT
jgi:hypothetical protein